MMGADVSKWMSCFQNHASGIGEANNLKLALKNEFQYTDKKHSNEWYENLNILCQFYTCWCFLNILFFCAAVAGSRKSSLSKRVSELEDACRVKEAARVDLELQLTQVQENLKKSLAGGVLGAPVELKPPLKVTLVAKKWHVPPACSSFSRLIRDVFSHRPLEKRHKISTVRLYRWTVPQSCVEDPRLFMLPQERSCRRPRCCLHSDTLSPTSLSLSSLPSNFTVCHHRKGVHTFLKAMCCSDLTEHLVCSISLVFLVIGLFCCTDLQNV